MEIIRKSTRLWQIPSYCWDPAMATVRGFGKRALSPGTAGEGTASQSTLQAEQRNPHGPGLLENSSTGFQSYVLVGASYLKRKENRKRKKK